MICQQFRQSNRFLFLGGYDGIFVFFGRRTLLVFSVLIISICSFLSLLERFLTSCLCFFLFFLTLQYVFINNFISPINNSPAKLVDCYLLEYIILAEA